jgi:hypothetical protein
MLIVFPESSLDFVRTLCADEPVQRLRSLTRLLQAHADGLHIIVIPPSICRVLEDCERLSEEQRGVAAKVRLKFSELSQLQGILPVYAELSEVETTPALRDGVWHIPFDWIAAHGISQTHLICEDLYDCEISHEAARDFLHSNNLSRLELALDHTAGGGGNTHRVLKAEAIDALKVCICVVDSDRSNPSPLAPLGATATDCLGVTGDGVYELFICEGRELENHLPIRLVDKLRATWHGDAPSAKHALFSQSCPGIWSFADLKTGLRRREADLMNGEEGQYWQRCADTLPHSKVRCCPNGCTAQKGESCKQVVVEPLGRTLLKEAVAYLKDAARASSPKRSREYLPSPNDPFWRDLGRKVAAYGIGIRINSTI